MKKKFICYDQYSPSNEKEKFAVTKTIEEAAKACNDRIHGDRNNEAYDSIMARKFYMVGYGPRELSVEEVEA